jgi:hypothetical protein
LPARSSRNPKLARGGAGAGGLVPGLQQAVCYRSLTLSEVVYARVPDALKRVLKAHAAERGLSLTSALVGLLERGLEAIADERSLSELERKLAASTSELAETQAQLKNVELGMQAARLRERRTARAYSAFAERARHELAPCPRCRKPLRGSDLLASGRCPHCNKPLTSLLVPTRTANLDHNEYVALLGALGVLVGLALTTDESTD